MGDWRLQKENDGGIKSIFQGLMFTIVLVAVVIARDPQDIQTF